MALLCPCLSLNIICVMRLLTQDHILSVALEECEEAAPLAG